MLAPKNAAANLIPRVVMDGTRSENGDGAKVLPHLTEVAEHHAGGTIFRKYYPVEARNCRAQRIRRKNG